MGRDEKRAPLKTPAWEARLTRPEVPFLEGLNGVVALTVDG